jgi:hypothetical protein
MKRPTLRSYAPAFALCLLMVQATQARAEGSAPAGPEKTLLKMIEAVKAESYDAFLVDADASLKKQFSRQQFEGMCGLYTKPLKRGYAVEYLGQLRQRGMAVYLWKVSVPGEQEDVLVKLAMKDGRVGGVAVL